MNKSIPAGWIANIFFFGVLGLLSYVTWHAVYNATGNNIYAFGSLFIFDLGAYSGYQMLTGDAEGAHQRNIAKLIMWVDFLLASAMVAGGLDLIEGTAVRWVMLVSACFNGGSVYYYKTHAPAYLQQAQEQDEQDRKIQDAARNRQMLHNEAMRQANANIMRQARPLGALMALRAQAELKYAMRLPMTADEQQVFEEDVIDADALPIPADYIENPGRMTVLMEALKAFFTGRQRTTSRATPSQQEAPSNSDPQDDQSPTP